MALIAVDTNLLVYAHRRGAPQHAAAQQALTRAASRSGGWGVPLPCLAEFWTVATHPSSSGGPSTPAQARAFIRALEEDGGLQVLSPQRGLGARLLELAERKDVRGPRVFDLQIGLIAHEAGASELWTHDRRFLMPPGLRRVDPLASN